MVMEIVNLSVYLQSVRKCSDCISCNFSPVVGDNLQNGILLFWTTVRRPAGFAIRHKKCSTI